MAGCSASCKDAAGYARSMRPDGSWANINYNSTDRVVWSAANHWQNLKTMATAMHCEPCQPPPPPSSAYLASIKRGVDYWLSKDYLNPNWWWNDFGKFEGGRWGGSNPPLDAVACCSLAFY